MWVQRVVVGFGGSAHNLCSDPQLLTFLFDLNLTSV